MVQPHRFRWDKLILYLMLRDIATKIKNALNPERYEFPKVKSLFGTFPKDSPFFHISSVVENHLSKIKTDDLLSFPQKNNASDRDLPDWGGLIGIYAYIRMLSWYPLWAELLFPGLYQQRFSDGLRLKRCAALVAFFYLCSLYIAQALPEDESLNVYLGRVQVGILSNLTAVNRAENGVSAMESIVGQTDVYLKLLSENGQFKELSEKLGHLFAASIKLDEQSVDFQNQFNTHMKDTLEDFIDQIINLKRA